MRSLNTSSQTNNSIMSSSLNNSLNSSNLVMSNQKLDWETLRKQARQLENEIDSKLVAFSKLSSNFSTANNTFNRSNITPQNSNNSTNSINSSSSLSNSSDLMFLTLSNEIEESLKKLNQINSRMSDSLNSGGDFSGSTSATVHTLQRHRDILRDYSTEYEKTKRNIVSIREREKLLSNRQQQQSSSLINESGLNNRNGPTNNQSNNQSTSLYMKEYDHIKNSHNLIDQQLEIAELTKENLQSQHQALRLIQQKMNTLAHKFPLINSLMQKIKFKKRKDSIVLATVISICLIIMILYLF